VGYGVGYGSPVRGTVCTRSWGARPLTQAAWSLRFCPAL